MPRRPGKKTAGIALACAAAAYTFLVPIVNERFGINLPQLNQSGGQVVADSATATPAHSDPRSQGKTKAEGTTKAPGPLADRMTSSSSQSTRQESSTDSDSNLKYGLLRDLGGERYISPAGLMYTPGSAEGHRLKHVERHARDDPGRPGSHGVFDGGMEGALQTIDKAYERAKKKQRTTVKEERGSTVYTVDMGGRVGYVGGQTGKRKRNPMARRVKIVVQGNRIITAFPM